MGHLVIAPASIAFGSTGSPIYDFTMVIAGSLAASRQAWLNAFSIDSQASAARSPAPATILST
jgi:hypothetical protein